MAEQAVDIKERPEPAATESDSSAGKSEGGDQAGASAQPTPSATKPAPVPGGGGSFIAVRDRYSIYYDRAIPALDMPNALAFEGEDRKQPGWALYALVCKPEMQPRISVMRVLKGNELANTCIWWTGVLRNGRPPAGNASSSFTTVLSADG